VALIIECIANEAKYFAVYSVYEH